MFGIPYEVGPGIGLFSDEVGQTLRPFFMQSINPVTTN